MSQSRKINELNINIRRAEHSRDEWRRRAQIAENERDALKAFLHHERGENFTVQASAPEPHAPTWVGTLLATVGAFMIIATAIIFIVIDPWEPFSDAWLLLAILMMAGVSLIVVGHRLAHHVNFQSPSGN